MGCSQEWERHSPTPNWAVPKAVPNLMLESGHQTRSGVSDTDQQGSRWPHTPQVCSVNHMGFELIKRYELMGFLNQGASSCLFPEVFLNIPMESTT